jgi:hypothetical protein
MMFSLVVICETFARHIPYVASFVYKVCVYTFIERKREERPDSPVSLSYVTGTAGHDLHAFLGIEPSPGETDRLSPAPNLPLVDGKHRGVLAAYFHIHPATV